MLDGASLALLLQIFGTTFQVIAGSETLWTWAGRSAGVKCNGTELTSEHMKVVQVGILLACICKDLQDWKAVHYEFHKFYLRFRDFHSSFGAVVTEGRISYMDAAVEWERSYAEVSSAFDSHVFSRFDMLREDSSPTEMELKTAFPNTTGKKESLPINLSYRTINRLNKNRSSGIAALAETKTTMAGLCDFFLEKENKDTQFIQSQVGQLNSACTKVLEFADAILLSYLEILNDASRSYSVNQ